MISIQLMGRPVIHRDGESIKIDRRKSRAMIFFTAAHLQPVSREALLDLLWPDLPRHSALQTLRSSLYGIKKVFADAIRVDASHVSFDKHVDVDVWNFKKALDQAGDGINAMEQALSLYQGEFLQGFYLPESIEFEDWLNYEREHYRQMALRGFTRLAAFYKDQQDFKGAIRNLDRALIIQPLQEDLQRERILLHYLAGDRPGAIQSYDTLRKLLDQELGVPPMAETRSLYDKILQDKIPVSPTKPSVQLASPIKVSTNKSQELPFVGREEELDLMQKEIRLGKFVLIEGEAGIGKTRLANEYVRKSSVSGVVGAARELERHLPYQPFIEIFRSLITDPTWPEIQTEIEKRISPIWLNEISRILPELRSGRTSQDPLDKNVDEGRLWEGIRQLLIGYTQIRPLIIIMDDLQWAGDSTLGLLGYLLRQGGAPGLSMIGTAKPASSLPNYPSFLRSLMRQDLLIRLVLYRLPFADVLKLSKQFSPQYAPPMAEWLQRISEGNPYILMELVKYARQKSLLQPDGSLNLSTLSTEALIPQTVYSLLQARLEALSDPARRILDAGVVMGRRFNFDVAALAAGISEFAAIEALEELMDHGLVRSEDDRNFTIDHSLIMEVSYRELGDLRLRYFHRRVAEAIENLLPSSMEDKAGQLAWHFAEAGEPNRAASYARMAGKQAMKLAAWHEAIEYFKMALQSQDDLKSEKDWQDLAEAHAKAGEFAQSTDAYREAISLAVKHTGSSSDGNVSELRLAMARSMLALGRYQEVIQIAQQVCAKSGPESVLTAELIWGTALSLDGSDLVAAQEHLRTAEELWRQTPGLPVSSLAQILFESGSVAAQLGELELAIEYYQKSLAVSSDANDSGSLDFRVLAHNNLAYHMHLLGVAGAREEAERGLKLAQDHGILGMQTYLYSTLGEIAFAADEDEQAEVHFKKGLEMAQRFAIAERVAGITANMGLLAKKRGQKELALHYISTALGQAQSLGARHLEAQIHLWLAPLLPGEIGKEHLNQAHEIAINSGRKLLLEQVRLLRDEIE